MRPFRHRESECIFEKEKEKNRVRERERLLKQTAQTNKCLYVIAWQLIPRIVCTMVSIISCGLYFWLRFFFT